MRIRTLLCVLVIGLPTVGLAGLFGPDDPGRASTERAIDRMFKSLVRIYVVSQEPQNGRMEKELSAGSGAIISEQGHIITNHHVAGRAIRMICRMYDGEEVEARLVGTDPMTDISVIQLDLKRRKSTEKLRVARFGNSDKLSIGDTVLAMGCPVAVTQSVTRGIVSNTQMMIPAFMGSGMTMEGESVGSVVRWIGHDAIIFHGNSGGPLVNLDGQIVGINELGLGSLGGAIPGNLAKDVAEQLIQSGKVERAWTGIEGQERPKNLAVEQGVLVGGVLPGSPATAAGLQAGDVIVEYDGTEVDAKIPEDIPGFNRLLLSTPIGKQLTLKVLRGGKPLTLSLTTTKRDRAKGDDCELKEWGMVVRNITALLAIERQRPNCDGVLVASTSLSSAVSDAKPSISPGDIIVQINKKPVRNVAELQTVTSDALKGAKTDSPQPLLVAFDRGTMRYLTVVKVGKEKKKPDVEPARKPGLPLELQALSPELAEALGLKGRTGALVAFVYPRHAAEKAGIKQGDILVKIDEDPVRCARPEEVDDIYTQIRRYRIGQKIDCQVLRNGKPVTLNMALEEDFKTAEDPQRYKDDVFELTVQNLTELERLRQQIPVDLKAVRIVQVERGSWTQLAQVGGGDLLLAIDSTPTPDINTAERLLKKAAAEKVRRLVFFLRRGVHTFFVEIEPDWQKSPEKAVTAAK